ncbi:MAG: gene transfer agent family protein [Rhizobiaceae bacterium]
MNPNRYRGEVIAELDGAPYRLCLTLGALAELEGAYEAGDLAALVSRFASGKLSATDLIRITGAALRGGGMAIADEAVARMQCAGGVAGFATLVAELLTATFAQGDGAQPPNP